MKTRRQVLVGGAVMAAGLTVYGCGYPKMIASPHSYKTTEPRRAFVFWFSQTGHTERMGKVIADTWRRQGMAVDCGDIRHVDLSRLDSCDVIVVGSPVFYYDVPAYVQEWLGDMPTITGTPVAAYSTYGGTGHNQHNTACTLLEILVKKGGVPAGLDTFGNMSTFAPTWSALGNEARILRYSHLPDEGTFEQAREFAGSITKRVKRDEPLSVKSRFSFGSMVGSSLATGLTKRFIGRHEINSKTCISCGTCVELCPVDVIDLDAFTVDRSGCVACMACINNCPVQAFDMTFLGREVYGFEELLLRKGISIVEPDLLRC